MAYFVFGKTGYEDQFVEEFADKKTLEAWLIRNEEGKVFYGETAGIDAVVYGELVDFEVVKKATHIAWK